MEPWDTIPVSWYRLAASSSLEPSSSYRHIVYRLGRVFTIRREPSGELVVTSSADGRRWQVREDGGQIFVWYGPEGLPAAELPDWSDAWRLPIRKPWTLHVAAPLCVIDENSCDTAHFPVVHRRSINASTMEPRVDEHGRLVIVSRMEAYAARVDHQIVSTLHSPSAVLVRVRFLGLEQVMLGMFTPIDERHTEMCFIGTSRRYLGLGWLLCRLFFQRMGDELRADIPIWEKLQYRERPMLCDGDGAISLYRKWYRGFFPEAWAERHRPAPRPAVGLATLVAGDHSRSESPTAP